MSERGSPADHAATDNPAPEMEVPQGTPDPAAPPADGTDAKSPDASSPSDEGAIKADAPKPTLADVVKKAVAPEAGTETSPGSGKEEPDKADPAAAKNGEQDDAKLSFHNHPRWQEVTGQNRELKAKVESLTPDAEQYRSIDAFMKQHTLTPDEVGDGFILMAMMKAGDPRALQKLDEYRAKISAVTGDTIPDDIQAQIDSGEISETAGKELAKNRAELAAAGRRDADRQQHDQRQREEQAAKTLADAQAAAVGAWDVETRKSDPDFPRKEKAIARYARALIQERGMPKTADGAVALIKEAYSEVNKDFAAALPPKEPIARAPVAPSSNGAKPAAPKTLLDAVRQAANG